jgi:aminopeptidase
MMIRRDVQSGGKPGGSCTAALFLKAFVHGLEPAEGKTPLAWAHIDIAGSMEVRHLSAAHHSN